MDNLHNPIARIIEDLQYRWIEETSDNEDYKFTYWLIKPDEADIINGFYKLESSQYGILPEFFLVMISSFTGYENYSRQLITDILNMWEQDKTVKESNALWDTDSYRTKLVKGDDPDILFKELLIDFHQNICNENQDLVFGLIPQSVNSFYEYNNWLIDISEDLPAGIKFSILDHKGKNYLKNVRNHYKEKVIVFECDFELDRIIRQMATSGGDAGSPDVNFRKCLFEMADGASSNNKNYIHKWGEKALHFAQMSGSKSFYATAYLVYAGFLLQLKSNDADELLDKGITIAEKGYKNGDIECSTVLLQLYGFKSAFYNIKNNNSEATLWMMKQARLAFENKLGAYAISLCRMSARMAKKSWDNEAYLESLELGYHAGDELSDDELKLSEIPTLAYYYSNELRKQKDYETLEKIGKRMVGLFGEEWEEKVIPVTSKSGETVHIPEMRETIESLNLNN